MTLNSVQASPFEDLFVFEMANNHWGELARGVVLIQQFGYITRVHNIKAGIKLQLRDVDQFIHAKFRDRKDIRYIQKTIETQLPKEAFQIFVKMIRQNNCIPMATPFDERSVDLCEELGIEILKVASSDINDWVLLERIAKTHLPVIVSSGGASLKSIDELVTFFTNRHIPLALNHCVSLYPSEDYELELSQILFLKHRYPHIVIGFSSHEYHDWHNSMLMAYAMGARTFERHVDIPYPNGDHTVSSYCSLPGQIDLWIQAWKKAKELYGRSAEHYREPSQKEIQYLDALVRGVYAKHDLPIGHILSDEDIYLAIPLQKGQISCRELVKGTKVLVALNQDEPILVESLDTPYKENQCFLQQIKQRGL